MEIRDLPLHDLVLDPNLNLRDRLDQDTVDRYVESWHRMPPVTVFEVDGRWLLADGFHRHAAAVTLGRRSIPAEVRVGNFTDALDFVAGANLHHGLPLTRAERRRAIEVKLRLHHERSDRHLAEELAVGRELVAKIRRQLIEGNQIPAGATRIGADGKSYPALPKDPNERLPKGRVAAEREDPRDWGGTEADAPPWDEARPPSAIINEGPPRPRATPPWEDGADAKTIAMAPPVTPAAPTIDEMLGLMARQIVEVVTWTQAEGFVESYKSASANARGLFQTAALKLAARADQLRKA
jgi:ParB-like chromosome segregation protein Spo0J